MNASNNPLIAFLQENLLLLFSKSPAFNKVWQVITGIPVLIIALPEALRFLNIDMPQVFDQHIQTVVGWASFMMFIMAALSGKSQTVAVDQNGVPVKQTNPEKRPFTSLVEQKAINKEIKNENTPPVDVVVLEHSVKKDK